AYDADLGRARDALVEPDPAAQRRERARRRLARELDFVLALVSIARMKHAVGPVAVVREEQEPLRVRVQTTDRIEALARAEELDHGPAAPLVARGRHDAARLVHHDVAPSRRRRHGALVHADTRAGADLRAELGDEATVHPHAPAGHGRL